VRKVQKLKYCSGET